MGDVDALFRVVHTTRYAFEEVAAGGCSLTLHLEPRGATSHQLVVRPLHTAIEGSRDGFGNAETRVRVGAAFGTLTITAVSVAPGRALDLDATVDPRVFLSDGSAAARPNECGHYARAFLKETTREGIEAFVRQLGRDFVFDATVVEGEASAADLHRFLRLRRGVCQDFAHFAIGCLRAAGLPACYLSGYLPTPGGYEGSHAWVAVYLSGRGWLHFDPTHGRVGALAYVTLGVGRDYADVAPVKGTLAYRGACRLSTSVTVTKAGASVH